MQSSMSHRYQILVNLWVQSHVEAHVEMLLYRKLQDRWLLANA